MSNVQFTKTSTRQFNRMSGGICFLKRLAMQREIAEYIDRHEAQGAQFDTICQEIRYDDNVYLLMMRCQGVWYITDIWSTGTVADDYAPLFNWQRMKRGWQEVLAKVLIGWTMKIKEMEQCRA